MFDRDVEPLDLQANRHRVDTAEKCPLVRLTGAPVLSAVSHDELVLEVSRADARDVKERVEKTMVEGML